MLQSKSNTKIKLLLLTGVFHFTVWNCQDFSVIQILREVNFEESRSSKTAFFANNMSIQPSVNTKIHSLQNFKMADFESLDLPTLISRKI